MTRPQDVTGLQSAPRWIVAITGVYVFVGLVGLYLWHVATQMSMQLSSAGAESLSVVGMAVAEAWLCVLALRSFPKGAALRPAWLLILLSASLRAACGVVAHLFGLGWQPIRWSFPFLSGPIQMALLGAGLLVVVRVLRNSGFRARLGASDWALAAVVAVALALAVQVDAGGVAALAGHVLLLALFLEALLLRRSLARMGRGLVAKCWSASAIAILMMAFGQAILGVVVRYAPAWPVAAFQRYTSFLAAAALALAPAYQVAAQRRATQRGSGKDAGSPEEQPLLPATSLSGS